MSRWRVGTNFYSEGMGSTLETKEREREDQKGVGVRERISMVNVDLSGTNEEERKARFTYGFLRSISSLK
jgi:hypothetical protein